jgi:glutathionyl-hydroquinone reductase
VASNECLTLSDVRLFVTLIRFDEVYVVYFKTDKKKVSEYPNIMRYLRDLWKIPGFKETTKMDHIKTHYFKSHGKLNYFGIIPAGPGFLNKLSE